MRFRVLGAIPAQQECPAKGGRTVNEDLREQLEFQVCMARTEHLACPVAQEHRVRLALLDCPET